VVCLPWGEDKQRRAGVSVANRPSGRVHGVRVRVVVVGEVRSQRCSPGMVTGDLN
jgi:hypothetical protein